MKEQDYGNGCGPMQMKNDLHQENDEESGIHHIAAFHQVNT